MQPADLLGQAVKLLSSARVDLEYRVVIDRAYYGAYHAALQFEERLPNRSGAVPQNAGSHESLFQRLERPDSQLDNGLKQISKYVAARMRMLKPLRELASYKLDETVRVDQAEEAVRTAKDILDECAHGCKTLKTQAPKSPI